MRRGSLFVELCAAIVALGAIGVIAASVVRDRREATGLERRAAAVETARNALERLRRGADPALPPGWTVERTGLAPGVARVAVRGEGVVLATVLAETTP